MKYLIAPGEDATLDADSRRRLRGSFVELSDGVTHYELAGPDGADVAVLVGGLTIPLFYWDALVAELHERGLRTLACSAYGRGYSDRVRGRYDETLFARQLSELAAALELTRPLHMVGTSMGALITTRYALDHRATVSTLTFAGPAGLAHKRVPLHRLLANDVVTGFVARRFGRRLLEGHLGHNVRDPHRSEELTAMVLDTYRYQGSMYAFFDTLQHLRLSGRDDVFRRTGELGLPTLLLWGADDEVTPTSGLEAARELLQPREHHIIPDCGHMAPFERPREVAAYIASFATSQAARDR